MEPFMCPVALWGWYMYIGSGKTLGNISHTFIRRELHMTRRVTYQEIQKLADISKIYIDKDEAERLVGEIEAVLGYAEYLYTVAASAKELSGDNQIKHENRLREDVAVPGDREKILAQAPEREDDYFVVPRIIKE